MSSTLPSTALCLACSSSFPPKAADFFVTPCCGQPICSRCLRANPRLARYNPCLSCLGGVSAVGASRGSSMPSSSSRRNQGDTPTSIALNLDGALRDVDTFVLGDDDDDSEEREPPSSSYAEANDSSKHPDSPPPTYDESSDHPYAGLPSNTPSIAPPLATPLESHVPAKSTLPVAQDKYYIQKNDTLQGISFKLGVDARVLCRLNKLPSSTLSTTPHLLHTRSFLTIPLQREQLIQGASEEPLELNQHEANRIRERAAKRLQLLTKETDSRIAKAYVSLADDASGAFESAYKFKEDFKANGATTSVNGDTVEGRAIDHYLDDDEWEANERRQGRGVYIPPFPFSSPGKSQGTTDVLSSLGWWKSSRK